MHCDSSAAWFSILSFPARDIRSLTFVGDALIDLAGGGRRFVLPDGRQLPAQFECPSEYDAGTTSPSGQFSAAYKRTGTSAILLNRGVPMRTLTRAHYHANAYEYPIALFRLPDGREAIAHCPDQYNRIEIDDLLTGERLTPSDSRKPADIFHSRLNANCSGTWLLSAGWVWHPWGAVSCYPVIDALAHPAVLDDLAYSAATSRNICLAEENAACWLNDTQLAITATDEKEDPEEIPLYEGAVRLRPNGIVVFDVPSRTCTAAHELKEPPGTVMAIGQGHVISFYDHPKLISLATGEIFFRWSNIPSGRQNHSIIWGQNHPPLALDPAHRRFAVFNEERVTVVIIDENMS